MSWTEKQKTHMLLLLEGREERAEQRRKKLLLAKMAKGEADPKLRKCTLRFNLSASDMLSIFFSRIDPPDERGCMCWNNTIIRKYGSITFDNVAIRSHRLAWIVENGPIPIGMQVLHRCDNPPCCNPEHLFLGTIQDNVADMDRKGRRVSAPITKLSHGDIISIRKEFHSDRSASPDKAARLALKYGVSAHRILGIVHVVFATDVCDQTCRREPLITGSHPNPGMELSESQQELLSSLPSNGAWLKVHRKFRSSTIKALVERGFLEHKYANGGLLNEVISDGIIRRTQQ